MKGFKLCIKLLILCIISLLFLSQSSDASASTANVSSANVNFWSSSSQSGQVQATVSLPWSANIGGSASNRQSFYLNSISMTYPISAASSDLNVFGRLVMRFEPYFTDTEDAYFCDIHLNDIHNSVTAVQTSCNATVIYNYTDNTTYSVTLPIFFNYTLPSGALAAYVDYNQSLPNTALSSITANFVKTGNYDIYSVTNGYSLVLTTLASDASYYITDSGGNVDLSPLVNQNQTIINQNQQIIDGQNQNTEDIINNQNQNTEDIIKSNQRCSQSLNLIDLTSAMGSDTRITNFPLSLDAGTYTISFKLDDYSLGSLSTFNINSTIRLVNSSPDFVILTINSSTQKNKRYSYTFTINENTITSTNSNIRIANSSYNAGARATLSDVQIEKGSVATEYIPYGSEKCVNYTQEYNDKQYEIMDNISNQSSDIDSSGENLQDSVESATSSISSNISSILGALSTSASDCLISIQAGDNGVLQLNNMNLCSMPTEIHNLIHAISSIIITISVLWISFNLLSQFLDIYENYLGAGGIRK